MIRSEACVCICVTSTTEKGKSHATSKAKAVRLSLSIPIHWRIRMVSRSWSAARHKVPTSGERLFNVGGCDKLRGSAPIGVREIVGLCLCDILAWLKPPRFAQVCQDVKFAPRGRGGMDRLSNALSKFNPPDSLQSPIRELSVSPSAHQSGPIRPNH